MKKILLLPMAMLCLVSYAQHEHHQKNQEVDPTDHSIHQKHHAANLEAPISVMGSHMHEEGGWMVSYRFMKMSMKDLINGTDDITNNDAHDSGYMMTPLEMDMNMHMVGVMYAPSNKLTLMSMFHLVENQMDMQMRMMNGMIVPFSTSSSGFGDIKIAGLYNFMFSDKGVLHGQLGVSIPTGSIDEKHVTAMSDNTKVQLPYPMQIGSGTFDAELGMTYVKTKKSISWGHQLKGLLRIGENSNQYSLGNQYVLDNWLAVKMAKWMSFSGRIKALFIDSISGADPDLNPMMGTTADPMNSGGTYVNSGIGINTYMLEGLQMGVEYQIPMYQDANGIQLKQQSSLSVGAWYAF